MLASQDCVAYTCQSLTNHEHNYHSTKHKFLALKWATAEQFQEYLCQKPFVVKTDNNPLTYILTTTKFRCYLALFG